MSALSDRLLARFRRRLAQESPAVARAILDAWREVAATISESQLAELLASSSIDRIIAEFLDEKTLDRALAGLRTQLRLQVERTVTWSAADLPKRGRIDGNLAVQFNVLNPRHIDAVRALDTAVMRVLKDNVRESFRAFLENGIRDGIGPRKLASQVKDWIGLSKNQVEAVANFRGLLESGDREALTRALRDRRFDSTLRRLLGANGEGLTTAQIDRMTNAYLKKMVAFNAETVSRTATLDALKVGNRLTWQQAIEDGFVPRERVMKRWVATLDDRTRDEHAAMNGETVPFDSPYPNGDMYPGESDPWNCRCREHVFVATPSQLARAA